MFHVEHTPIQESASTTRTFLNQPMDFRIYNLNRKRRGKLGERRHSFAGHLCAHSLCGPLNPHSHTPFRRLGLSIDDKPLATRTNQILEPSGAERSTPPQHVNGLEEAGLARCIRAADKGKL